MTNSLGMIAAIGSGVMGFALITVGLNAISNPELAAKSYGLSALGVHWVPVWGLRDAAFGAAMISLLIAGRLAILSDGNWQRAAALVTAWGAVVGFGDGVIIGRLQGSNVLQHYTGGLFMAVLACSLYISARR